MKELILNSYDEKKVIYLEYEKKIKDLIEGLIKVENLIIHTIESRVKDRESLSKKIDRKEDKYTSLEEITDTVGLRIITYFEDDVDKIANLLTEHFFLEETVDKRNKKNPDGFGYASLHYVLKLKEPRASLLEYQGFKELNFEIQIRSILQHAWAEIEHDLGYKSSIEIPVEIRRNFSRISSLLELADLEFIRIKQELSEYTVNVKEKLEEQDLNINLDNISLFEFVNNSEIVNEMDSAIISGIDALSGLKETSAQRYVGRLMDLGINTIGELDHALKLNKEKIINFAVEFIGIRAPKGRAPKGISIFYLTYVLAVENLDTEDLIEFLRNNSQKTNAINTAEKLQATYKLITK